MATTQLVTPPNGGRSVGSRGVAQDKLYVTNCKLCGWGIFRPQRAVWSLNPMGLVHEPGQCREETRRA